MMSVVTWQLLAVLLAAALLGLLIGLSGMRLHQARRQKEEYNSYKSELKKLNADCDALNSEKATIMHALESEKKLGEIAREKQSHLSTQQETLQVHAGLQAQRISKLDAELHVAEEKCIRLERDFASFKANKLREVRMLKVNSDEWLDNEELPVLSKKVPSKAGDAGTESLLNSGFDTKSRRLSAAEVEADPDLTQPIIASELDIPSLAESELPDSVDALEFELVDADERN